MAVDGAFLRCLKRELEEKLIDSRIDKITQPSREELIFSMRGKQGVLKLYMSTRVQSPRVHLITENVENPETPPMFCMLLRKYLIGAKLVSIAQHGLERVLAFCFHKRNEIGKEVTFTLYAELMGRNSNIVLVDEQGKIVDALKRVDFESSIRPILPGVIYENPPQSVDKMDLLDVNLENIKTILCQKDGSLSERILDSIQGLSPLLCRECQFLCLGEQDILVSVLTSAQWEKVNTFIEKVLDAVNSKKYTPFLVYKKDKTPQDFSFIPILQYGLNVLGEEKSSLSELLEEFYSTREERERLRQQSHDLHKVLQNAKERILRKIDKQNKELQDAKNREQKRIFGDLLMANLQSIQKGDTQIIVSNFYDENGADVTILLDAAKSPSQNAQRYYKEYKKAQTAEKVLAEKIEEGFEEIQYIESVFDLLSRVTCTKEIEELREELIKSGYIRDRRQTKKKSIGLPPYHFISSDGNAIWVGRNNQQNDLLTLKTAHGRDVWLHTKNIPGSHVIIETKNKEPSEQTILEAATLAALHSKARDSAQVPVDYTLVKYVHKPSGAKPGKVIYEHQQTVYVTPDSSLKTKLKP